MGCFLVDEQGKIIYSEDKYLELMPYYVSGIGQGVFDCVEEIVESCIEQLPDEQYKNIIHETMKKNHMNVNCEMLAYYIAFRERSPIDEEELLSFQKNLDTDEQTTELLYDALSELDELIFHEVLHRPHYCGEENYQDSMYTVWILNKICDEFLTYIQDEHKENLYLNSILARNQISININEDDFCVEIDGKACLYKKEDGAVRRACLDMFGFSIHGDELVKKDCSDYDGVLDSGISICNDIGIIEDKRMSFGLKNLLLMMGYMKSDAVYRDYKNLIAEFQRACFDSFVDEMNVWFKNYEIYQMPVYLLFAEDSNIGKLIKEHQYERFSQLKADVESERLIRDYDTLLTIKRADYTMRYYGAYQKMDRRHSMWENILENEIYNLIINGTLEKSKYLKPIFDKYQISVKHTFQYPETITIDDMELSVRTYNCLRRTQIDNLGKLGKMSEEELGQVRNLGQKSIKEILEKIEEYYHGDYDYSQSDFVTLTVGDITKTYELEHPTIDKMSVFLFEKISEQMGNLELIIHHSFSEKLMSLLLLKGYLFVQDVERDANMLHEQMKMFGQLI